MVDQTPERAASRLSGQPTAVRPRRHPSRYAELTYTSFDDGASGGGWQIKQTRGDLTDEEQRALRSQVTTRIDAGVELPRFPTPEEISRFPRRLAYAPAGSPFPPGAAGWWHTAEAGTDASGRPGNVFCHVVLDRTPEQPPSFRPIDLWRSPSWLTPYGAEQVAAAELPPRLPSLDSAMEVDDVIDFCFADFDRIAVLGPLLDACVAAMSGGPRVVLVLNEIERAAQWIGVVSRLTSAVTTRHLYFSTLERQSGLTEAIRRGLQLVCVPQVDLDALDHERGRLPVGTVLLCEDEFPELGDLARPGEPAHPHITSHGDKIAVTPWSVLARLVLEAESPEQAGTVLSRIDPIAEQVAGLGDGGHYAPDWPLAMSIALSGDVFAEALPEAALVIGRHSPAGLDRLSELYRTAAHLISTRCGESTGQAWEELRSTTAETPPSDATGAATGGSSIGTVLIFDNYLRRVIVDHEWLARPDGVPLPDPLPAMDRDRLSALVDQELSSRWHADGLADGMPVDPVVPARLAEVLIRTGLADEKTISRLRELTGVVGVGLAGADGPELVKRIGPLSEATLNRVIRPGVPVDISLPQSLGRRLRQEVLDWLYPQRPEPISLRVLYDRHRSGSLPGDYWLRAERDWAAYVSGGLTALGTESGYAVWTMLDAGERSSKPGAWQSSSSPAAILDWDACLPLLADPIDPDDLYCLIHRYQPDRRIAVRASAATLLTVAWSGDPRSSSLQQLCRRLQQRDLGGADPLPVADELPQVREWLADRSWATAWWASRTAKMMNTMNHWAQRTELPAVEHYAADVRSGMAAVLIIELIHGRPASDVARLLRAFGPKRVPVDQTMTETVAAVINSSEKVRRDHRDQAPPTIIGPAKLLVAVLRADEEILDGRLYTDGARWLAGFRTRRGEPLIEELLRSWLQRADDRQQRSARDEAVALLQESLSAADNSRDLERAVAGRVKQLRRRSGS